MWWTNGSDRLSTAALSAIESADELGVSAVSCWEVGLLTLRGRLKLDRDFSIWVRKALARPRVTAIALDPNVAIEAAWLELAAFPRDPADRMIYATARANGATLVTMDRRIREYDPRGTLW